MRDLRVLEILVCCLLFPPLVSPFVKTLRRVDGLNWLFPLTLLIVIAIFPAYGFRPECIPLFLCALSANIVRLVSYIRETRSSPDGTFNRRKPNPLRLLLLLFLFLSTAAALYFSPSQNTALIKDGVRTATLFDEARQTVFLARIYGEGGIKPKGIMVVIPPLSDSFNTVDKICAAISGNGFITAVFMPKNHTFAETAAETAERAWTMTAGTVFEGANHTGRLWEESRSADIRFIFANLDGVLGTDAAGNAEVPPIFALGYGAGGAALVYAASDPTFVEEYPALSGIITVESRLWSLFFHKDAAPPVFSADDSWFRKTRLRVTETVKNIFPHRLNGVSPAPRLLKPALFLTEYGITRGNSRDGMYAALLKTLHASDAPVLLLAARGVQVFDYTDYPAVQPLYSALAGGAGARFTGRNERVIDTARLVADFAAGVLEPRFAETGFTSAADINRVFGGLEDGYYVEY
jgi:hypothetical protein